MQQLNTSVCCHNRFCHDVACRPPLPPFCYTATTLMPAACLAPSLVWLHRCTCYTGARVSLFIQIQTHTHTTLKYVGMPSAGAATYTRPVLVWTEWSLGWWFDFSPDQKQRLLVSEIKQLDMKMRGVKTDTSTLSIKQNNKHYWKQQQQKTPKSMNLYDHNCRGNLLKS